MQFKYYSKCTFMCWSLLLAALVPAGWTHEAKDFDDSILYRIEFGEVDFEKNPEMKNHLRTFYSPDHEEYNCVIPTLEDNKEDKKPTDVEISPLKLLYPTFSASSCSYRIEAYWSYEICHGFHIRQYHEEREGKSIKFQEYYLGKWNDDKTAHLSKVLEEQKRSGIKHKSTKIDGINYPYFEMEMTDGTLCEIIGEPRTTKIRYVCYPHGKNEIYSFKETSSCNYEAIILTSLLCIAPVFHPEESKEVSIKCMNTNPMIKELGTHKPLSLLRQELRDLQISDTDYPASKANAVVDNSFFAEKYNVEVDKLVHQLMDVALDSKNFAINMQSAPTPPPIVDLAPIKELLSGKTCLTGGTGWWKYEFCHRVHVRQFHKDKKSEDQIFLGYFDEVAHRQWIQANPDKAFKKHRSTSIWHHYEGGLQCDRTGKPREVDVKLTCAPITSSPTAVTMYLLEPKTCQYILVVESPIICDLMHITDEYGFVEIDKFEKLLQESEERLKEQSDVNGESKAVRSGEESIEVPNNEESSPNAPKASDKAIELPMSEEVHD